MGERRDHLAHHPLRRQDHDVDRRVRVEPEDVLEEHRVAPERRVEDAEAIDVVDAHEHDREPEHGRRQEQDDARRVEGPDEERQARPGEPFGAHRVRGHDEVDARHDRRDPEDEDPEDHRDHRQHSACAVGRVERPAGVGAAGDRRADRDQRADEVDVEAQQVEPREREVLGADHHRKDEVAEHVRDRRDHEQPDHDHAVEREHSIVGGGVDDGPVRREELRAEDEREDPADEQHEHDDHVEHQADALVIGGEEPAAHSPRPHGGSRACRGHPAGGCLRSSRLSSILGRRHRSELGPVAVAAGRRRRACPERSNKLDDRRRLCGADAPQV